MSRTTANLVAATLLLPCLAMPRAAAAELSAAEIVARHVEAHGGSERWSQVETLRLKGTYSAFSFESDFTLIRQRGDLYRLDFGMLEAPAVRARDAQGPWALHKLLWPEPTRTDDGPYRPQMERESFFGPLLLDHAARGITVVLAGPSDIDGQTTIALLVTLADKRTETWHLDPSTFLEVAVDSQVQDFTQASALIDRRTFFDDFRDVEGLIFPHRIDIEFGHRLESMSVTRVEVNSDLEGEAFSPPPAPETVAEPGS